MDLSLVMNTLMSADSLSGLSEKTGASQKDVSSVLTAALPLLLNGAGQQAQNESTSAGFFEALSQHGSNDTSNLSGFLGNVDMDDGEKIIAHLLGANTTTTTQNVAQQSGLSQQSTTQIMSAAAPLLMSLLGQQSQQSSKNDLMTALLTAALKNVDVGSLLMGLLGANTAQEESKPAKKPAAKKKTGTTTAKKKTGTTTAKKKTAAKKPAAKKEDDGIDIGDVANLLTSLLK